MIPDSEAMIDFAKTLEEVGESFGWDKPPVLGGVQRSREGYSSFVFPVQPSDIARDGDVVGALLGMARMFMRNTHRYQKRVAQLGVQSWGDNLAGLWWITEAWMTSLEDVQEGMRIADLPAALRQEVRVCALVDCGGRSYHVTRVRGQEPEVVCVEPGSTDVLVSGNVSDALRRMLLAIGVSMRPGQVDMQRLGMVGAW